MAENSASYPNVSTAVLQGGLQPLNYYLNERNRQDAQRAQREKLAETRRINRNKRLDELNKWAPDKAWTPFDEQVIAAADHVRAKTRKLIEQGYDPERVKYMVQKDRDRVNMLASKSMYLKEKKDEMQKFFEGDENFDWGYYKDKVYDALFEEGDFLKGRSLEDSDFSVLDALGDDWRGINKSFVANRIVDQLPEMINTFYSKANEDQGDNIYNITEIKRNTLGAINPKTGKRTVNITPEFITMVRNDPYGKMLLDGAEQEGIAAEDFLKDMFAEYGQYNVDKTPRAVGKGSDGSDGKITKNDWTRYQTLRDAIFRFDEKAITAANDMFEGVDVEFIGDDYLPGETKPDRIKVVMPVDNRGERKTHIFSIVTPEEQEQALIKLNQLWDATLPAKFQIGTDKLLKMHEERVSADPLDLGNDPLNLN